LEQSFSIFPLGDSAITIDLGNHIDEQLNRKALALLDGIRALRLTGVKDIIVAYSSVTVLYDPVSVAAEGPAHREGAFTYLKKRLEEVWRIMSAGSGEAGFNALQAPGMPAENEKEIIRIPVCYEVGYSPDLDELARKKGRLREDIVSLHTSLAYRVYMIGFLPGFPYLGKVHPELEIRRKDRPVPVTAGGVGIAGNQTGIYPLNSPGGWQIIGRTPLRLFDPYATTPVALKIGDWVQFFSVTKGEFLEIAASGKLLAASTWSGP
jgi:inhibitor of KinA